MEQFSHQIQMYIKSLVRLLPKSVLHSWKTCAPYQLYVSLFSAIVFCFMNSNFSGHVFKSYFHYISFCFRLMISIYVTITDFLPLLLLQVVLQVLLQSIYVKSTGVWVLCALPLHRVEVFEFFL